MTVTPELLELSRKVLKDHGHADAMPDDPGSIDQLTVALRSLLKALEPEPAPGVHLDETFKSVPKWQSDPEHFDRVEIRDSAGAIIGHGSQYRGSTPSTSAGRYEYDRRREVLARARFHVTRHANHKYRLLEYDVPADALIDDISKTTLIAMREEWLETGRHPKSREDTALGTTFLFDMVFDDPSDVKER